jgi:hypothetical protein
MGTSFIKFLFFFILSFYFYCLEGQIFSTSDLLRNYTSDSLISANKTYANGINDLKFKIPIVEEINFRTETDQFDFGRQEYALRTMFNGFNETKYYAQEKVNLIALKQAEMRKEEKELLYRKYQDLVNLRFNQELLPIFDSLEVLYNQKLNLLITTIATGEFIQPKDILKIEETLYELSQKRKSALITIENNKKKLGVAVQSQLLISDWISLSRIENIIQDLKYSFPETELAKYNITSARNESNYLMEKANNNRILDYAQLRYSKRANLLFQDELSIGIGLRLPYKGSNIRAKNEFSIKENEITYQKTLKTILGEEDFNRDMISMKTLLEEIKFYSATSEKIFKTLNENHMSTNLEISLAKKMVLLVNMEKYKELEFKINILYLNLLNDADKISQQPLRNFLSEGLNGIN